MRLPDQLKHYIPLIPDSIEFTPELIHNKIMNLPNSKSPWPDGWPIEIIKSVSEFIAILLSIILKRSFNSGALLGKMS